MQIIAKLCLTQVLEKGEGLRLDRQDRGSDGQKARFGWLRLYAYSRWRLDV
jgi:hypothetical protein